MGWILSRAKASKNAKAPRMLITAETPISPRFAINSKKKKKKVASIDIENIKVKNKGGGW